MERYEDFWVVTGQALVYALRGLGITATEAQVDALMDAYLTLSPFPEVPAALRTLGGTPLAILSNGSPRMLEGAVRSSGLDGVFAHVLSVDAVGIYKPSPRVYELAPRALGLAPDEIVFVSSNGWDVAGAAAFGFRTCWCNRANAPAEELEATPDYEVDRLDAIPGKLGI
jgi:2-haloacid dehalogenase